MNIGKKHVGYNNMVLLAAICKSADQLHLKMVYCTDGKLVATDCKRLAVIDCSDWPEKPVAGYHQILKSGSDIVLVPTACDTCYPDYQRVIPAGNTHSLQLSNECINTFTCKVIAGNDVPMIFNLEYLADCYKSCKGACKVEYLPGKSSYPILIGWGDNKYIVMPMGF